MKGSWLDQKKCLAAFGSITAGAEALARKAPMSQRMQWAAGSVDESIHSSRFLSLFINASPTDVGQADMHTPSSFERFRGIPSALNPSNRTAAKTWIALARRREG
jgi:hypothetical protein